MKSGKVVRDAIVIGIMVSVGTGGFATRVFSQSQQFGRMIAAMTVGRDSLDRVRSLYGPGATTTVDAVQSLCYHVERDRSYLSESTFENESRIRSISLTTFANVSPGCRDAGITGKHLMASGGVALGDPMANVVGAFGPPAETRRLGVGQSKLVQINFPVAGGNATCMFEQDKLVLISIELK